MPIDADVYFKQQPLETASRFARGYESGARMRDLADSRAEKSAIQNAHKKHSKMGPDGKMSFDSGGFMSDISASGKVSGEKLLAYGDKFESQRSNDLKSQWENKQRTAQILGRVNSQESYTDGVAEAERLGIVPKGTMNPIWNKDETDRMLASTLSYKDQLELQLRQQEAMRKGQGGQDPLAQEIKHERLDKYKRERAEAEFKKTPEGRLQSLNSGDKQRLDNVRMGFEAIGKMNQALGKGDNTFSLVGDNNFTLASSAFEEALGRMQSGGAIGEKEVEKYIKMRPRATDSKEMQATKLAWLESEFAARFKTLGFNPEDVGLAASAKSNAAPGGSFGVERANAGQSQVKKTSEIEW